MSQDDDIRDRMRRAADRISYSVFGLPLPPDAPKVGWSLCPVDPYSMVDMRSCQACGRQGHRHSFVLVNDQYPERIAVGGVCGLRLLGETDANRQLMSDTEHYWQWRNVGWETSPDGSRAKKVDRKATARIACDYSWSLTLRKQTLAQGQAESLEAAYVATDAAMREVPERDRKPYKPRPRPPEEAQAAF